MRRYLVEIVREPLAWGVRWRGVVDGEPVGELLAWRRPDGRQFLFFGQCRGDAYGPLAEEVSRAVSDSLFVEVHEADSARLSVFSRCGFKPVRRESRYELPVEVAVDRLARISPPGGVMLVCALDVDEDRLRRLDDRLRQDVPGTDGWEWRPGDFREETFESDAFDPDLYWVAVTGDDEYLGLVRVWNNAAGPHLGLVAVLPGYRRRGLARALLARALHTLHEREHRLVTADVDDTNVASRSLLAGLGARRVGGTLELARHPTNPSP